MAEMDNFIVKSIEEIKTDIKSIYTRLEVITHDLHSYKNQKYKCQSECDRRYFKISDIELIFKRELDKYFEQRYLLTHKKTELVRNILQILTSVAPYIAIVGTYLALRG
jgi:hypothetical protein